MTRIESITALEILGLARQPDPRMCGHAQRRFTGRARVPSGASTGVHEAVELRDGDPARFGGKGVLKALANIEAVIGPELIGFDAVRSGRRSTRSSASLTAPRTKPTLGANAILAVSLASSNAAAAASDVPLYRHLGGDGAHLLPVPLFNVLNGGAHAQTRVDFQEFMILPIGLPTFREALRAGAECFHALRKILHERGLGTGQGDEGGYAPDLDHNEAAMELLMEAIGAAGYAPGRDIAIGLDPATSELYKDGRYELRGEGITLDAAGLVDRWESWVGKYPIVSLEDGMAEDDWDGWKLLTDRLGGRVQLVGDDIFVTNSARLQLGIDRGVANSILIKLNQIGTVTETLATIDAGHREQLLERDQSSQRRDRGHIDRRPCGCCQCRPDQDGCAITVGAGRQVQPAVAHRARARRSSGLRGYGAVLPDRAAAGLSMARRVDPVHLDRPSRARSG